MIPYLLLLICLLPLQVLSVSLQPFTSCLPPTLPRYFPQSPQFKNFTAVSFVNNQFKPLIITVPRSESHVSLIIRCARKANLRVCPRSGGHSLSGSSLHGQVLIDLRNFRKITLLENDIVEIGTGATLGEVLWKLWTGGRRWFPSGICSGVGVTGFMLGGGYGPYSGKLGLGCDSMIEVRMLDRFGNIVVASRNRRKELFWGLCGAGGGEFGVVMSIKLKTASSSPYDRSVVFRMEWPWQKGGEVLQKWSEYGEEGGRVWVRASVSKNSGVFVYGACYDVQEREQCMALLRKAKFFAVPGRNILFMIKMENAMQLHAFYGPEGGWSERIPSNVRRGILGQRFMSGGEANERAFQSGFLGKTSTTNAYWQRYVNFCRNPGRESITWNVCQLTLFGNAMKWKRNNAFAFRDATVNAHYIIGAGTEEDKEFAYWWMSGHFNSKKIGVYVNYPELSLGKTYPRMYWGKSLQRLKVLKRYYDPDLFFSNPQPIPLM